MITVHLRKGDVSSREVYLSGIYSVPDETGWLSIIDADGFTLAMYPRENVMRVVIEKAGETDVDSENTN